MSRLSHGRQPPLFLERWVRMNAAVDARLPLRAALQHQVPLSRLIVQSRSTSLSRSIAEYNRSDRLSMIDNAYVRRLAGSPRRDTRRLPRPQYRLHHRATSSEEGSLHLVETLEAQKYAGHLLRPSLATPIARKLRLPSRCLRRSRPSSRTETPERSIVDSVSMARLLRSLSQLDLRPEEPSHPRQRRSPSH